MIKKKPKRIEKTRKGRKISACETKIVKKKVLKEELKQPLVFPKIALEKPFEKQEIMSFDNRSEKEFELEELMNKSHSEIQKCDAFNKTEEELNLNDFALNSFHFTAELENQQSQITDVNFPYTSDIMEDEGMEPIFHKQYQKVQCLDSPKMSISSSKKGNSLLHFKYFEDPPEGLNQLQPENTEMFSKMQNFCNKPTKMQSKFKLIAAENQLNNGEKMLVLANQCDLSINSQINVQPYKKSSSRKSRRNSRKNSSVENFNIL